MLGRKNTLRDYVPLYQSGTQSCNRIEWNINIICLFVCWREASSKLQKCIQAVELQLKAWSFRLKLSAKFENVKNLIAWFLSQLSTALCKVVITSSKVCTSSLYSTVVYKSSTWSKICLEFYIDHIVLQVSGLFSPQAGHPRVDPHSLALYTEGWSDYI